MDEIFKVWIKKNPKQLTPPHPAPNSYTCQNIWQIFEIFHFETAFFKNET